MLRSFDVPAAWDNVQTRRADAHEFASGKIEPEKTPGEKIKRPKAI
jgi:hypothetical protein